MSVTACTLVDTSISVAATMADVTGKHARLDGSAPVSSLAGTDSAHGEERSGSVRGRRGKKRGSQASFGSGDYSRAGGFRIESGSSGLGRRGSRAGGSTRKRHVGDSRGSIGRASSVGRVRSM